MNDHLPECPLCTPYSPTRSIVPYPLACICDRLRACEQRVIRELTFGTKVERLMWERGVAAAREAVAALPIKSSGVAMATDALAAIDALRGEQA